MLFQKPYLLCNRVIPTCRQEAHISKFVSQATTLTWGPEPAQDVLAPQPGYEFGTPSNQYSLNSFGLEQGWQAIFEVAYPNCGQFHQKFLDVWKPGFTISIFLVIQETSQVPYRLAPMVAVRMALHVLRLCEGRHRISQRVLAVLFFMQCYGSTLKQATAA